MRQATALCLLMLVCLGMVYWGTLKEIHTQIDAGLRAEGDALLRLDQDQGIQALRQTIASRSTNMSMAKSDTGDAGPRQYLLVSPGGHKLAGNLALPPGIMRTPSGWITLDLNAHGQEPGLDSARHYRLRAHLLSLPNGSHLLIGQSLNETDELRNQLLILTLIIAAVILSAGLASGWWVGRNVVQRLERVTDTADRIMTGDLTQRIQDESVRRDEFSLLSRKLNAMLERIERLMRTTREVTENIAHDLRNPLTRLRGHAEMALMKPDQLGLQHAALQKAIEETDSIVATLNAILNIAQIESDVRRDWVTLDLSSLCRSIVELYAPLAEERQLHLDFSLPDCPQIHGNRQLIAQAVGNLLDNAIKYTPTGGRIQLALTPLHNQLVLSIADNGIGIPESMLAKVLERFVRLDASRNQPGNGLGLAMVKAVADQHGALLTLSNNHPGLDARLIFNLENS